MITADGVNWAAKTHTDKLVGSVSRKRSRDIHVPAVSGEYPVFVEQCGEYRMYTYNQKIVSLNA